MIYDDSLQYLVDYTCYFSMVLLFVNIIIYFSFYITKLKIKQIDYSYSINPRRLDQQKHSKHLDIGISDNNSNLFKIGQLVLDCLFAL